MEFDQAVVDKARDILQPIPHLIDTVNICDDKFPCDAPMENTLLTTEKTVADSTVNNIESEVVITAAREGEEEYNDKSGNENTSSTTPPALIQAISNHLEVKKEEAEQQLPLWGKSKRFTAQEDRFLKLGIEKYGKGCWSLILHDDNYIFHPARTRDSLRMRAETCAFKIRKHVT